METTHHHRGLIQIRSFDVISREQDDAGIPVIAIDAQVHAPFIQDLVPYHIGRPHVSIDIVARIATLRPIKGIEVEVVLYSTLLDLCYLRCGEGGAVGCIVTGSCSPRSLKSRPAHQVGCLGSSPVGTEDVVRLGHWFPHDARVMHADAIQHVGQCTHRSQCRQKYKDILSHDAICIIHYALFKYQVSTLSSEAEAEVIAFDRTQTDIILIIGNAIVAHHDALDVGR